MALEAEDRSEEFLEHARRAYGDLRNPYYGFFSDAQENNPWMSLLRRFEEFLNVEEWTDRTDDVSFSYVLKPHRRSRSGWLLRDAGLTLLSAEEIEMTVDFHPPDGRFPVSVFVMLFSESDVPWYKSGDRNKGQQSSPRPMAF